MLRTDALNSCVYWGKVYHRRSAPQPHEFVYPAFSVCLDLSELTELDTRSSLLFGYNRPALFSIRDSDYLLPGRESIREKLRAVLASRGAVDHGEKIYLITVPRVIGYVFNPVSYYLFERPNGDMTHLLCEVNNTFGEKHLYLVENRVEAASGAGSFEFDKQFFVSPFLPVSGRYSITVRRSAVQLQISVTLRDGEQVVYVQLAGTGSPFTSQTLRGTILRFPLAAALTMTRITLQARRLIFRRGAAIYEKPLPQSDATVFSRQRGIHRARLWLLRKLSHRTINRSNF